jgi:hypothetical protein
MAKGEFLPDVRFSEDVRDRLGALLAKYDASAVISQLEEIAALVPALAAPDVGATRATLDARRRSVRACLRAFARRDDLAEILLDVELTRRGWSATKTQATVREGLTEIDAALTTIAERFARRRRGRGADSQARWLIEETARVLAGAGAPITRYEDGTLAQTLRILWPAVLGREAPIELRPWFKALRSQR